jgi:aspartate carbamoyltransferase regulatory subunit
MDKGLLIQKIKDGTVIDHIPPGKALFVLKILGIDENTREIVSFAMNVPSSKIGIKDIVKVENRVIGEEELNKIALIGRDVTINIVQNYDVVKKFKVTLPSEVIGVVKCPNPSCISNTSEPVSYRFVVVDGRLKCHYCGKIISKDVEKWIVKEDVKREKIK